MPAPAFCHRWKAELILACLVGVYALCGWAAAFAAGWDHAFRPLMYLENGAFFGLLLLKLYAFFYVVRLFVLVVLKKPQDLKTFVKADLAAGPLNRERWLRALPVFAAMIVFLSVFTSMKILIPHIEPFGWDKAFAALDRLLHFGIDPWRILHPVLGHPPVTYAVNLVYNAWLPVLFVVLYWQLFSLRDPALRARFFIAFALVWAVNGSLLAILFSSAGPCYFERVTNLATFAPLMDYLHHTAATYDIMAVETQERLWSAYAGGENMLGGGISAMPSIHVATATLFLLLARSLKLKAWPAFAAFFALILLGSVHLGWHYAVDGYLAILATIGLWTGAGRLLRFPCPAVKS